MHFFNPAPVLKLVEVVRTVVTEQDVVDDVTDAGRRLGKTPVVIGDKAGFIANALLFGYLNHAVSMFESHYATREDIDAAMRLGCGYPMGPLALLDLIGLDTAYEILDTMYRQSRDRLHAPAPILKQMVTAGLRGRKTGRGFYTYEGPDSPKVVDDAATPAAGRRARRGPRRASGSGSSAPARWPPASSRCSPRPGTTSSTWPAARRRSPACAPRSSGRSTRRCCAGSSSRPTATRRWHDVRGSARLDDLADRDLVVEAVVEELSVKQALFATLDEICRPGTVLATTTSSLPVIDLAAATVAPGRRRRPALLQPRAGDEARRGGQHRLDRGGRRWPRRGPCASGPASTRWSAATGPASSSTRCCSPTSTTRSRCCRPTTRPSRTSTPR